MTHVLLHNYQLKISMQKKHMFLIQFFSKYTALFTLNKLDLQSTISKTSGDVKQLEGKPVTLVQNKNESFPHNFYVI